ncbi:MAG: PilZ domain-containing protein [Nitrospirota bacterium]
MSGNSEEKRRHKRIAVDILDITGKITLANSVKILNISVGGVLLKVDRQLHVDRSYELRLGGKGKHLAITAMVVRSELSESVSDSAGNIIPIYSVGMQFINTSGEKMHEMAEFIKEYYREYQREEFPVTEDLTRISGLRLHVRFHIDEPENASVYSEDTYKVKKLSLGGMLVEGEHELPLEARLPMEITLPGEKLITVLGRIAMCEPVAETESRRFESGIEFVDMPDQDRQALQSFINTLEIR